MAETRTGDRRWLFTVAILTGSFLLFLVQPMVARIALPRLGGAPNVWNSAMLVYQALLLAGYAYAHFIGRFSIARQVSIHLAVLLLAAFSLPIALADIAPPEPGMEAFWVPWLFLLTVGPAFFAVSAQAPLVQRWYAAHPQAGNPYPLYAASNLGSFAGLLAYPLVLEPLLPISIQSSLWAMGYGVLVVLVAALALSRWNVPAPQMSAPPPVAAEEEAAEGPGWKKVAMWLALSAVPSGLMLSTTTYLTTDIMAMPLLWVIPLGLYLLSFSIAFADRPGLGSLIVLAAPAVLIIDGAIAMYTAGKADLAAAFASVVLLFVVSVTLHARLYTMRPPASQLTRFYLVMSAGGVVGGLFAGLVSPVLFDWTWEHPILIVAAAALVPLDRWTPLFGRLFSDPGRGRMSLYAALFIMFMGGFWLHRLQQRAEISPVLLGVALVVVVVLAIVLAARRWSFVLGMTALLLALGGVKQIDTSLRHERERSYFGIYSVGFDRSGDRILMHGTTVHGVQRMDPDHLLEPTSYYSQTSGIGHAMLMAPQMFGPDARIGVVGLGVGTLACYRQPDQQWTFFEIDPLVLDFSRRGMFGFIDRCAPDAHMVIGDARLELEQVAPKSFDLLTIDAFSSDAIPLHLLTREALQIYFRALADDGVVLMHISNRYISLGPVLAQLARDGGYIGVKRFDDPGADDPAVFASTWIALSRDPQRIAQLTQDGGWTELDPPAGAVWTDEYASILPHISWSSFL